MTPFEVKAALETALNGVSETGYPILSNIPVAWENMPNHKSDAWIRAQFVVTDSRNGVVGASLSENPYIVHEGFFVCSIFTKIGIGTMRNNEIMSELYSLFQNKTFDGVLCKVPSPQKIGDDKHGYYQVDLFIPFITTS